MPYGDVNFHGRKDEYFISTRWPEAVRTKDEGQRTKEENGPRGVCVRLEPPGDLQQPAMQMVTAQITLSSDEMREYRKLDVPLKKRLDWVFGRLAAKDAVRLMWWERHGERFFPADMELQHDEHGRPHAVHLDLGDREPLPNVSVSHAGGVMAALASFEPFVGIDLEKIETREASFESLAFDETERRMLDVYEDRDEAVTRFWCAKEAVAKALGRGLAEGLRSVLVRECTAEDETGSGVFFGQTHSVRSECLGRKRLPTPSAWINVELGPTLAAAFPQFADTQLRVFTQRYKNFIVATTFCDPCRTDF
jgi:phosphopantetheinyl transferase (holo-ACP synthase)